MDFTSQKVTVVMPLLNEAGVIESLVDQVVEQIETVGVQWSFVLVNDGSTDGSTQILDAMAEREERITVLHLSRNFGHQAALHAGLCHTDADAVIVMDSDAQDDPAAIPKMLKRWQQGNKVVYAVRVARKEGVVKRTAFHCFHRLMKSLSSVHIPADAGNFGLMDRVVVDQIKRLPESERYFPGLRTWVGYQQCPLVVARLRRYDDEPRVNLRGLFSLAKTALLSFSRVPLLAFYGLAAVCAAIGCSALAWGALSDLAFSGGFPTWVLGTALASFFGTINALGIAVLGEYVTRIYDQVRQRPTFVVARSRNFSNATNLQAQSTYAEEAVLVEVEQLRQEFRQARVQTEGLHKTQTQSVKG